MFKKCSIQNITYDIQHHTYNIKHKACNKYNVYIYIYIFIYLSIYYNLRIYVHANIHTLSLYDILYCICKKPQNKQKLSHPWETHLPVRAIAQASWTYVFKIDAAKTYLWNNVVSTQCHRPPSGEWLWACCTSLWFYQWT